jgi:hypothetical protein
MRYSALIVSSQTAGAGRSAHDTESGEVEAYVEVGGGPKERRGVGSESDVLYSLVTPCSMTRGRRTTAHQGSRTCTLYETNVLDEELGIGHQGSCRLGSQLWLYRSKPKGIGRTCRRSSPRGNSHDEDSCNSTTLSS